MTFNAKVYHSDADTMVVASGGVLNIESGGQFQIGGVDMAAAVAALPPATNYAVGVAASYKVARGVHQQVAATDTIVTGLTTVVAVVVSAIQAPTAKQAFVAGTIGNQTGAPAAGSIYTKTFKDTYAAADDFTDNLSYAWIAIGT